MLHFLGWNHFWWRIFYSFWTCVLNIYTVYYNWYCRKWSKAQVSTRKYECSFRKPMFFSSSWLGQLSKWLQRSSLQIQLSSLSPSLLLISKQLKVMPFLVTSFSSCTVQVNHCQKLLFLHQLTHNMTTDCSLNYKFNTWKFQVQTWGEHVMCSNCFWHSEQFLYTTCSPHVLQKEELLTKIYLYLFLINFSIQ